MNGSKNKDVLCVSVDHDVYHAIEKICSEYKYSKKSAICNDLLRQVLTTNGMLEA